MTVIIHLIFLIISIIGFSTLPFLFSLNGEFVFDDSEAIVKNKDVTTNSWTESFSNDFWGANIKSNLSHKSYRPLTVLSFRLNYIWSGERLVPSYFKITNLVCHSICCILVWLAFQIIVNDDKSAKRNGKLWRNRAYLSALLFCVHPIHVESVSGIVGRADVLAALLFFLGFIIYHKAMTSSSRKSHAIYLLSTVVLSAVSMLCKENGITILGFCILYEFANKFKQSSPVNSLSSSFGRVIFLLIAAVCIVYVRWAVMGGTKPLFKPIDNPAAFTEDTFMKVATFNYVYFLNVLLLVWPQWLCYDWSMGCVPLIKGVDDFRVLFIMLMYLYGVLLLRILIFRNSRSVTNRHIILAVSLIVVPFLPAANIFYSVGFVVAERVLYIPSSGFCLLIVIGLDKIIKRKRFRKIGLSLYCFLLIIFTLKSWQRSLDWRDEFSLFTSALSVCPNNAKVHYNVAKAADERQLNAWALEEYREAIRLYPEYYQAMNNLANLLKLQKKYTEAEFYLRKALSHKYDFPAAWMNLGIVLASTKRYNESRDAYYEALKYRKNYPDCYYNLANLNLEMNDTQNAIDNWFEAINLNPKHNLAWTNLLAFLDNTGQLVKATEVIPKALAELPDSPSVNFAVGNIYGKMERYEDAEYHFVKAIDLFEINALPLHYSNLGVLYHRWNKLKFAKKMYEYALTLDPNFRSALKNLKILKRNMNAMNGQFIPLK